MTNVKIVKNILKLSLSSGNASSVLLPAQMSLQGATVTLELLIRVTVAVNLLCPVKQCTGGIVTEKSKVFLSGY